MTPSVQFLCLCIIEALLEHYQISQPPVPVRELVRAPYPALTRELSLVENAHINFCDALWVRLMNGQGVMFVNGNLPEPQRRYAMAVALFSALCASPGGRDAGLPHPESIGIQFYAEQFARWLLMPNGLLPVDWQHSPTDELAETFIVPETQVERRREESIGA